MTSPSASQSHLRRARLPAIPDLRFEQSYLRSVAPYIHRSRASGDKEMEDDEEWKVIEGRGEGSEKGKGKEREHAATLSSPPPYIHVEWRHVALVTVRDQVLSPLLQGALWGVASHFLQPLASLLGFHIRKFFASRLSPPGEGLGAGWLRGWARSLGLGAAIR